MLHSAKEIMCQWVSLAGPSGWCRLAWGSRGSQLLELALSLPILLVLAVGGSDFSGAYNLKQKLNNAAREGARFGGAQSNLDSSSQCSSPKQTAPCSVQGIQNVVIGYLSNTQAQVDVCGMTTTTNPTSADTTNYIWTYSSACGKAGNFTLTIERLYAYCEPTGSPTPCGAGTTTIYGTRVTISHPYSWSIGHVIGLIGGSFADTITISSNAAFQQIP